MGIDVMRILYLLNRVAPPHFAGHFRGVAEAIIFGERAIGYGFLQVKIVFIKALGFGLAVAIKLLESPVFVAIFKQNDFCQLPIWVVAFPVAPSFYYRRSCPHF